MFVVRLLYGSILIGMTRPVSPSFPPVLDDRLERVLALIEQYGKPEGIHADIGSDHAHLPIGLIHGGLVTQVHIVEFNEGPLARARRNVSRAGYDNHILIHEGDGLSPLHNIALDSVSICGMGAGSIHGILERAKQLPPFLFLQPNDSPLPLRKWALARHYHIVTDELVAGHWNYPVLVLQKADSPDPLYAGLSSLEQGAALRYGILGLRCGCSLLRANLLKEKKRLAAIVQFDPIRQRELDETETALNWSAS